MDGCVGANEGRVKRVTMEENAREVKKVRSHKEGGRVTCHTPWSQEVSSSAA